MDLSQYRNVWVFAEQRQGVITPVVRELLGEGRKLAGEIGTDVCAILLGRDIGCLAKELICYGADRYMWLTIPCWKTIQRTPIPR